MAIGLDPDYAFGYATRADAYRYVAYDDSAVLTVVLDNQSIDCYFNAYHTAVKATSSVLSLTVRKPSNLIPKTLSPFGE